MKRDTQHLILVKCVHVPIPTLQRILLQALSRITTSANQEQKLMILVHILCTAAIHSGMGRGVGKPLCVVPSTRLHSSFSHPHTQPPLTLNLHSQPSHSTLTLTSSLLTLTLNPHSQPSLSTLTLNPRSQPSHSPICRCATMWRFRTSTANKLHETVFFLPD